MQSKRGSFAQSVNANCHKAMLAVNAKCYQIAKELFTKIVDLTPSPTNPGPYAEGVLVNNWFPVDGSGFSSAETDASSSYGAGSRARIKSLQGFQFFRKDGTVTLSNNVHYAYRAEVLGWPQSDGWSGRIGPYRMVARSLQAIAARYK